MKKLPLFFPSGIDNIWHYSADGSRKYRLDGLQKLLDLKHELEVWPEYEIRTINADSLSLLKLVHSPGYLSALRRGEPREWAESSGIHWQTNLINVFGNSALSLVLASKAALRFGYSGVISKGGHHAVASRGFGFNPINEIAICVTKLHEQDPRLRIAVIDLDIHLGNGLHQLLATKPNTLLVDIWSKSLKSWGNPVVASNVVSYKVTDKEGYWKALNMSINTVKAFSPNLVIYHSGMDAYYKDRLGGIPNFTESDIRLRESLVINSFSQGLVLVLGGGYVDYTNTCKDKKGMQELVRMHRISFDLIRDNFHSGSTGLC